MAGEHQIKVLDRLYKQEVPVLSSGAPELLASLTDESVDVPRLANLLERFPTIAARLISLANSAWSSPINEISSLEKACARLGLNVVKSTSIALAVVAPFNPSRCPAFDQQRYWTRALTVAELTYQLTRQTSHIVESQTAKTAGLLHNLGLLWIADQLPGLTQQAIRTYQKGETSSLDQALTDLIGVGYSEASGYLGEAWKLPLPLVAAMGHHRDPYYSGKEWWIVRLVGIVVSMVSAAETKTPWSVPTAQMEKMEIEPAVATKLFASIGQQLAWTQELAASLFAA